MSAVPEPTKTPKTDALCQRQRIALDAIANGHPDADTMLVQIYQEQIDHASKLETDLQHLAKVAGEALEAWQGAIDNPEMGWDATFAMKNLSDQINRIVNHEH